MNTRKIIEIFKQNDIDFVKLGDVVYDKNEKKLSLTFFYPDEKYDEMNSKKTLIEKLVKDYVKIESLNYEFKYKKAYLDEEILKSVIENYLQNNNKVVFYSLKGVRVKQSENLFEVLIISTLSEEELKLNEISLRNYLEKNYFYSFNFDFKTVSETENLLDKHREEVLNSVEMPVKIERIKVKNLKHIMGEYDYSDCYPIEFFKSEQSDVCTSGEIITFEEYEYNRKLKNGQTQPATRFSLIINSVGTKFNATIFPSKSSLDKLKTLKAGDNVAIFGNWEVFGKSFSFKVKKLALCDIMPYTMVKPKENKILKDYVVVKPEIYEEKSQINLFDVKKEKSYLKNNEFVVFDLETTGLDYLTCKVTEIGAVKIKNGRIVETFSTFVNPQVPISREITKLTSITDEMVKDAPLIEDVIPDFFKFCENSILVAQNIGFDFAFIEFNSRKINYIFNHKKEDTEAITKQYIKGLKNYKLKTIADHLNIPLINAHRAINDALCTAKVFISLVENFYED